jgi:riboflavin biosynthesis pyrimidine reductase
MKRSATSGSTAAAKGTALAPNELSTTAPPIMPLLEGGGGSNGAFLRAGLVDELNLILCPAVDGAKGAPSVFDSPEAETDQRAPVTAMTLESNRVLEGGAMLLRYRIQNADAAAAAGR